MEPFEDPTETKKDQQGPSGQTGGARAVPVGMGRKDALAEKVAMPDRPTVFRFDQVVININLGGFGS